MNKGRLFVVNEETLQETISTGIVSIYTPELTGSQWLKTVADIMADMLQIEIGDYIFLWETRTVTQKSRIHGIYRAISAPYYELSSESDHYPFKIKIERAYKFDDPLDEYDVLNCPYIKTPLWTITGKKVAGKSRGTSPLSQDEVDKLIILLIGKNPEYEFYPFNPKNIVTVSNPLKVDYSLKGPICISTRNLSSINPSKLAFFNADGSVKYEKILETIFNQEMSSRNSAFFSQIGIDVNKVIWFCNYLPYSIEQSEMDYLVIESEDGTTPSKLFLIEFIKTKIDESHIFRSLLYCKWLNETLCLGESITQPLIVCPESFDFITGEKTQSRQTKAVAMQKYIRSNEIENGTKPLKVYTYDFSTKVPTFIRRR